jgi:hypothetical protein
VNEADSDSKHNRAADYLPQPIESSDTPFPANGYWLAPGIRSLDSLLEYGLGRALVYWYKRHFTHLPPT